MAAINPPGYLHNLATHTAQTDRLNDTGLLLPDAAGSLRPRGGRRAPSDLVVTAGSGMNVSLSAGMCVVPQGQSVLGGGYICANDGAMTLAIAASNATLGRNDLVVARVRDSFYTGTQDILSFEVITGVAAASPTDPTLPTDSSILAIGRVLVPGGSTTATQFTFTMLAGGIQLVGGNNWIVTGDATPGIHVGQYRDHPTLGLQRWDGTAWGQPQPVGILLARCERYSDAGPVAGATQIAWPDINLPTFTLSQQTRVLFRLRAKALSNTAGGVVRVFLYCTSGPSSTITNTNAVGMHDEVMASATGGQSFQAEGEKVCAAGQWTMSAALQAPAGGAQTATLDYEVNTAGTPPGFPPYSPITMSAYAVSNA